MSKVEVTAAHRERAQAMALDVEEIAHTLAAREAAERDREDWRKGVAFICASLHDGGDETLSCVDIAERVLAVAAGKEAAEARVRELEARDE